MKSGIRASTIAICLVLAGFATAGEKEDEVIDKVVAAYGGDRIANLSSFSIDKKFLAAELGQSHTPQLQQIGSNSQYLVVDIAGGHARFEVLFENRGGVFQSATLSDGETATSLNYQAGTYGSATQADPYAFGGGAMRTTDAVLAYELNKAREEAVLVGEENYLSRPHELISMPFPLSPDLTLWVDKETGFISRMHRVNPQLGQLDYIFADRREDNGIPYATSTNFFVAGNPSLVSVRNESTFNRSFPDSLFELPDGLSEEAERIDERIDTSEMNLNEIAENVHHVGQDGGFSIFINSSDGLIAAGGTAGLAQRLDHYRQETGNYQPLAYQVVTHHHNDHLAGMQDAAAAGATLITVADNVDAVKSDGASPDANILVASGRMTLGQGDRRVEIYEVSTIHAGGFLVTYVPEEKLIFIADHLGSPYPTGTPIANRNTVSMWEALQELDLDYDKIAVAHGARVFSKLDMQQSVANFEDNDCMADRPVCQ
jgi:glyoxylase-like metal-dependent hydrolase (beta-lactamase superfamily II)